MKNILIVGGAGYIGSHVAKMVELAGYRPIIFDNLSTGSRKSVGSRTFIEGDLANVDAIDHVFNQYPISAVMHFAAAINVGESVVDPAKYYSNNVVNTINLLDAMIRHHVNYFVFSSSAAIFGTPNQDKVNESHPQCPINPYGRTKLIVEWILQDYERAYGLKSVALRYFNAAGGDPSGVIKNYKQKESNLIPLILRDLRNPEGKLEIFGTDYDTPDGTCIRDYIHIQDLGSAHIKALERLFHGGESSSYNLGNGNGFSNREVIAAAEKVTGSKVNIIESGRRPGDPPCLIADSEKASRELGWTPQYTDLEEIISHAWNALND